MSILKNLMKWILFMFLGMTAFMFICWGLAFLESGTIVNSRMREICAAVAENNCLPEDEMYTVETLGGAGSDKATVTLHQRQMYTKLLNDTVTLNDSFAKNFIEFQDDAIKVHPANIKCEDVRESDMLWSLDSALQRGQPICVEIETTLKLPLFIYIAPTGEAPDVFEDAAGNAGSRKLYVKYTRKLTIYGRRYYTPEVGDVKPLTTNGMN